MDWDAVDESTVKKLQKLSSSLIIRKRNRNAAFTVQPPLPFGADKIQLARAIFTFAQLLTGVTDVTLGETPGSLQSGQAIEGLQEGANLMTRSRASRIEDFYMRVGQKLISRVFQFFPSDRVVHLVGPTASAIDYAVKRSEWFIGDDGTEMSNEDRARALRDLRFVVSPGSSAPGTRIRRGEMMLKLFAATLVPGIEVLRAVDFPEPEELYKRAQEEAAKRSPDLMDKIQKMVASG